MYRAKANGRNRVEHAVAGDIGAGDSGAGDIGGTS
jgi:hypothetical protein